MHDLAGVGLHLKVYSARMGLEEVSKLGPWTLESATT